MVFIFFFHKPLLEATIFFLTRYWNTCKLVNSLARRLNMLSLAPPLCPTLLWSSQSWAWHSGLEGLGTIRGPSLGFTDCSIWIPSFPLKKQKTDSLLISSSLQLKHIKYQASKHNLWKILIRPNLWWLVWLQSLLPVLWAVRVARLHLLNEFCGPFLAPILLTSCLSQDALQRDLLPGSGQAGPLGNPLCYWLSQSLAWFLRIIPKVHTHQPEALPHWTDCPDFGHGLRRSHWVSILKL